MGFPNGDILIKQILVKLSTSLNSWKVFSTINTFAMSPTWFSNALTNCFNLRALKMFMVRALKIIFANVYVFCISGKSLIL